MRVDPLPVAQASRVINPFEVMLAINMLWEAVRPQAELDLTQSVIKLKRKKFQRFF